MAAPLATVATTIVKKLSIDFLSDPEKTTRQIIIICLAVLLVILLLFSAPIILLTSLPSPFLSSDNIGANTQVINEYKSVVQQMFDESTQWVKDEENSLSPYDELQESKTFTLSWTNLIAIHCIRYNQDFSHVSISDIRALADRFVQKQAYKTTRVIIGHDAKGNPYPIIITTAVIHYSTISFESMMNSLGLSSQDKSIAENINRTLLGFINSLSSDGTNNGFPLAYADAVTLALAGYRNIPQTLMLALITHESSGDWESTNQNSNGTLDAGLCQINSANWPKYNLSSNPYDVTRNLSASTSILNTALQTYGNEEDALYAYNAGNPTNGKLYNPSYAPTIEAIKEQLKMNDTFVAISYTQIPGHPISIVAAERDGNIFYNPSFITITDSARETITVSKTSGDGNMWAPQAATYPINTDNNGLKILRKGDLLTIRFPDGKFNTIEIKQEL